MILYLIIGGFFLLLEIGLRWRFGFGNPLLYLPDPEIGYLLAPNQQVKRMGNRIKINEYSMRCPSFSPQRPQGMLRLFLVGDSVANGAWWTDQSQTISTLIQQQLQPLTNHNVEVLNASANSWGPRNQVAYLRRYGVFDSQFLILLLNTDDLFGTAPTSLPVGNDRNYPSHKPPLALLELYTRYLRQPQTIPALEVVNKEGGDRVGFNLQAIQAIQAIATQSQTKLTIAMTPLRRELGAPGPKDYEIIARQRLLDLSQTENIPYLDFLPQFNNHPQPLTLYRDHIHLSPEGNQLVTKAIIEFLKPTLP